MGIVGKKKRKVTRQKKVTHQSVYKEYCRIVSKDSTPLSFREYDKAMKAFFWRLSRTIIVDIYEWKLPFAGGYVRIAKKERRDKQTNQLLYRRFYWYWDVANDYTRLTKKRLWSFQATVGWKDRLIGERGLSNHYMKLKCDNLVENYDVPNIDHRMNAAFR